MNVIVFASRKGGSGKSTLTAHLAAHANRPSRRCMLIDCDPQGSISLWHKLRGAAEPQLSVRSPRQLNAAVGVAAPPAPERAAVAAAPNAGGVGTDGKSAAAPGELPSMPG